MKLNTLPKITTKRAKRIGRGHGSGKGKTSGRGTKGQNARGRLSITHSHFEGGTRPLIKRLPIRRGKSNPKISKKPLIVKLEALNILPNNVSNIDLETLIKFGIVAAADAKIYGVKILGDGQINRAFTINLAISKSAAQKIEKLGGKIVLQNQMPVSKDRTLPKKAKIHQQQSGKIKIESQK